MMNSSEKAIGENNPFLFPWQLTLALAAIRTGSVLLKDGMPGRGRVEEVITEWVGSTMGMIAIPLLVAYLARGRKGFRNGFNRWFFWSAVPFFILAGSVRA